MYKSASKTSGLVVKVVLKSAGSERLGGGDAGKSLVFAPSEVGV